jgi:hypothetical protein
MPPEERYKPTQQPEPGKGDSWGAASLNRYSAPLGKSKQRNELKKNPVTSSATGMFVNFDLL